MKPIKSGPTPANNRIMFLGERVGSEEVNQGKPLVGYAGVEFSRALNKVGVERNDSFITNVAHEPYGQAFFKQTDAKEYGLDQKIMGKWPCQAIRDGLEWLPRLVEMAEPRVIVCLGDVALWALTGQTGINRWRGSIIEQEVFGRTVKIIPTFNPAAILRTYGLHPIFEWDLKKAGRQATFDGVEKHPFEKELHPSFDRVMDYLENEVRGNVVACDIETKINQVSIIGFATSKNHALTIPFFTEDAPEGVWTGDEETQIILKLREVLTDPETKPIWHNGMFDCQVIPAVWGFIPRCWSDTMIAQHVCYPGLPEGVKPKSLNFMASVYCLYSIFWKEDSKADKDTSVSSWKQFPTDADLSYNADDVLYTYEVWEEVEKEVDKFDLRPQYQFLMRLFWPVLRMSLRGVRVDQEYKNSLEGEMLRRMKEHADWFETVLGHPLNPSSDKQMKALFYNDLRMKRVMDQKTGNPTTSDEALDKFKKWQVLIKPLCEKIQEYRSFKVFLSTFARAPLSQDGRMRCTFMIAGPKTFRFSSKKDAFGLGANLQTISKGKEE